MRSIILLGQIYTIRTDSTGNIKPDKEKSTEKIDGAVATIMALDRVLQNGGREGNSTYQQTVQMKGEAAIDFRKGTSG